ncbi:MAG: DUF1573 domain-containing protein [Bacteroidales bacterium]|nr:DUF1573 domain-containing protein [Bacteroidales bacterium]
MRSIIGYGPVFLLLIMTACGSGKKTKPAFEGSLKNRIELMPEIRFDTMVNDLGTVQHGEQVVAWFDYSNTGETPLIINNIRAGCGCTIPRWSKAPLASGESGSVRVIFDSSGKRGVQNIRITVFSNAANAEEELFLNAVVQNNH